MRTSPVRTLIYFLTYVYAYLSDSVIAYLIKLPDLPLKGGGGRNGPVFSLHEFIIFLLKIDQELGFLSKDTW